MRKFLALLIVFQMAFLCLLGQGGNTPPMDKSPMDMSYFPVNYPVLKIQDKANEPLAARVIYSRPQKAGRTIFGGLVKAGEVWRLGANEATELQLFQPAKIDDKRIKSGRYSLYAIVNDNSWTIILNKETDTWGSFKYDVKKDVLRKEVPIQKTDTVVENMTIFFEKTSTGCNLVMAWDNVKVALPISF